MSEKNKPNQGDSKAESNGGENENTASSTRRKLLKTGGFAAAAGITADKWTKPVVESTLLPAHATSSLQLIGSIVITGNTQTTPTGILPDGPVYARSATNPSPLDLLIPASFAQGGTVEPTPEPTPSPTPSPTPVPTPAPTPVPTPVQTPSPGCVADGQCISMAPPSNNQIMITITSVGTGMVPMMGALNYSGSVGGLTISGSFTDQSYTTTMGQITGLGCNASYNATVGGTCVPA